MSKAHLTMDNQGSQGFIVFNYYTPAVYSTSRKNSETPISFALNYLHMHTFLCIYFLKTRYFAHVFNRDINIIPLFMNYVRRIKMLFVSHTFPCQVFSVTQNLCFKERIF